MTLILSNDEIADLLPMSACLAQLDETYRELGEGRAMSRPRADIYGPMQEHGRYVFKSMDGLIPLYEVAATRLNSDVVSWQTGPDGVRKDKHPLATGGKWVGIVLLFSTRNGEPLAIMPDGIIQRLRVACTNALGAKYMAPKDASIYAQIGSGWLASGQAIAMAQVRGLKEIRVFSPTRANREKLAVELANELGIKVQAVDDARSAVRGADIVGIATNSVTPVMEADWLEPHAHVTCVKELELGDGILERSSQVVVHTRLGRPANYIVGKGENPIYDHDPKDGMDAKVQGIRGVRRAGVDLTQQPDLGELVTGHVVPAPPGTLTSFVNVMGMGIQFAALGALAYREAKARGIGHEIPTDWFLESVHS